MCLQVRAIKVIFLIWTNPKKGLAQKRILQRDATEGETYYEAIPTTAIFTFIAIFALLREGENRERESPLTALIGSDGSLELEFLEILRVCSSCVAPWSHYWPSLNLALQNAENLLQAPLFLHLAHLPLLHVLLE